MTKLTAEDYEQIQYFEKTYGSLAKTPDSELERTLWNHLRFIGREKAQQEEAELKQIGIVGQDKLAQLYRLGYGPTEVAAKLHLGRSTVGIKARIAGVQMIPLFRYSFEMDGSVVYVNFQQALMKVLGYAQRTPIKNVAIGPFGESINLKIYEDIHWFEVPDGAVYLTRTGWFVKRGLDSYESEDCRYDSQECEAYLAKTRIQQPRRNAKVGGNLR